MRKYELLFIVRPTLSDQEVAAFIEQVKGHIGNVGATITQVQNLGRRQLAYEIDHVREGTYVLMHFEGSGVEIAELDRRLRVSDAVLRHIIIRIDEELKRAERMKRRRQRKAARRARAASRPTREGAKGKGGSGEEKS
ncbi:30S ribosomal protein S6 [bacterium HR08]|nr:30S ribosomal protein S6 [bacterium HR08]